MSAKPIFVVRFSNNNYISPLDKARIVDELNDYHVFFISGRNEEVLFECYNCRDIEETTIKELEEKILKQINESA